MKVEAFISLSIGAFAAFIGMVYWLATYEPAGTTMLAASVGIGLIPGVFLFRASRRMAPRPEDRDNPGIDEGVGIVGSFPGSSIWPFVLAGGATLAGIGLVFGLWAVLPGILLITVAAIGASLESRGGA